MSEDRTERLIKALKGLIQAQKGLIQAQVKHHHLLEEHIQTQDKLIKEVDKET